MSRCLGSVYIRKKKNRLEKVTLVPVGCNDKPFLSHTHTHTPYLLGNENQKREENKSEEVTLTIHSTNNILRAHYFLVPVVSAEDSRGKKSYKNPCFH